MKNENSDCTCNNGSSQSIKGRQWKKVLFVAILFIAVVLVSFKLIGKNDTKLQVNPNTTCTQQSNSCDTTGMQGCATKVQPGKNVSCCPTSKK